MQKHFDVRAFLERTGIEYITHGPNVGRDNINCQCPFCGSADPSQHMGIQLSPPYNWGCWRDTDHRGKKLHRLIMALARCSYAEAKVILGDDGPGVLDTTVWNGMALDPDSMWDEEVEEEVAKELPMPEEFRWLDNGQSSSYRFVDYLMGRGFLEKDLKELCDLYELRYAISGDYVDRMIMPVYMGEKLVSWTGRSIQKDAFIRYKSTPKEESIINIYDCLYMFDSLMQSGGDILFVVEGPLDAIKVDFFARKKNCRATCLFSKSLSDEQKFYLREASARFSKVVLLLDPEELGDTLRMERELAFLPNIDYTTCPDGAEDPGDMTARQVFALCAG